MTYEDFLVFCNLDTSWSNMQGLTSEQVSTICEACNIMIKTEPKVEKT